MFVVVFSIFKHLEVMPKVYPQSVSWTTFTSHNWSLSLIIIQYWHTLQLIFTIKHQNFQITINTRDKY